MAVFVRARIYAVPKAAVITREAMHAGVKGSKVFLLFLSEGVLTRPFCLFEISTALDCQKSIMLMHESDTRHGAFDFSGDEVKHAPGDIADLMLTRESLPWRRRRFEQDAIMNELVRNSGLNPAAAAAEFALGTGASVGAHATPSLGLAPLPDTLPAIPDAYASRANDEKLVLDILLSRTTRAATASKVLAHGMGGLGKTTLAAATVRNVKVRAHYTRICFSSAGQEPALISQQRLQYTQMTGEDMVAVPSATVASQREVSTAVAMHSVGPRVGGGCAGRGGAARRGRVRADQEAHGDTDATAGLGWQKVAGGPRRCVPPYHRRCSPARCL